MQNRKDIQIGIPRVLNVYTYAPLFNGYLQSLGVPSENIVYSDYTNGELYRMGSTRGAIDPCFPAKIGIAHVHNLIAIKGARKQFNVIFFPMFDVLQHAAGQADRHRTPAPQYGDAGDGEGRLHQRERTSSPNTASRTSIR